MGLNFKENLRSELNYQDITLKELSARTDIPIGTLNCYLRPRATVPSVEAAYKIAQALNVSIEYLLKDENTGQEKPQRKLSREAIYIIRWIEKLNPEQCKAIIKLIQTF